MVSGTVSYVLVSALREGPSYTALKKHVEAANAQSRYGLGREVRFIDACASSRPADILTALAKGIERANLHVILADDVQEMDELSAAMMAYGRAHNSSVPTRVFVSVAAERNKNVRVITSICGPESVVLYAEQDTLGNSFDEAYRQACKEQDV